MRIPFIKIKYILIMCAISCINWILCHTSYAINQPSSTSLLDTQYNYQNSKISFDKAKNDNTIAQNELQQAQNAFNIAQKNLTKKQANFAISQKNLADATQKLNTATADLETTWDNTHK